MAVERTSESTPTGGTPRRDLRPRNAYRPGNLLLALLRRLLYLVVRTRVTPEEVGALGVDPQKPLCYVLQDRHLSSLLVLEEEVRRLGLPSALAGIGAGFPGRDRALFSVILSHNPLSTRTSHPSATLARMTGTLLLDPAQDVQLVPVTILWGRSPKSQDSLVKALFADAWASVGPLRQLADHRAARAADAGRIQRADLASPADRRRDRRDDGGAQGQSLPALPLPADARVGDRPGPVASAQPDRGDGRLDRAAGGDRGGGRPARRGPGRRRGAGAPVRVGDRVRLQLPGDPRSASSCSSGCGGASSTRSSSIHGEELAKVAPGKGLVYLPNHRSHIDYLLLSYLVYGQGLAPPHIAAGANLNLPLVGPLLRRGGAFFLRRSFKGEPLYAAVFREYLHAMLAKGFPIAYFIEGGRSRSGRTLAPKGGMLGMTIESYMRDHPRPLLLVPVHFSYEKAARGAHVDRRTRRAAEAGRVARRAGRGATQPQARLRDRARQFRHAAVDRSVSRPAGTGLARVAGRPAAGGRAAPHGVARTARWRRRSTPRSSSTRSTCSRWRSCRARATRSTSAASRSSSSGCGRSRRGCRTRRRRCSRAANRRR